MIKINNIEYNCEDFQRDHIGCPEHLHVKIEGDFKDNDNRLMIEHSEGNFYGVKTLPHHVDGFTSFLVYILQEGDSEL